VKRTRQERVRLGIILVGIIGFFAIASARLVHLQVINGPEYRERVDRQSTGRIPIPAERGLIYDRHGRMVAKNVTRSSLYAHPSSGQELKRVAAYLDGLYGLKRGQSKREFRLETNRFRWIERRMDDRLADKVAHEAPRGLYLRDETERQYPFGRVGNQVLGFTSIDNEGLSGFELTADSLLTGQSGWADIRRDGLRNTYRVKETALVKPVPAQSVVLTVDWQLQEIVEQELQHAVHEYNAASGMAAFVDCRNGDILALAHYDPEERDPDKPVKLRAISDQFEPGSAFKPFTATALLDLNKINFRDSIYCEMGKWKVNKRILHDDKELGWLNFRRIIELSSNIGLAKHTIELEGPELVEQYKRFGFGEKTGCGLPGEIGGWVSSPRTWSDYNIAAMAMGHSVAVNALQMALAMASIANRGELLAPRLVLGRVGDDGTVEPFAGRRVIRRTMKEITADSLRSFLRGVVDTGTGTPVKSPFVAIAGKTGTAEIPNLEGGGYYKHKFMASFCGFFPYEAPLVAGIVVLKAPHPVTYGGHTSGKAFRAIAERYSVCNPDLFANETTTFIEDPRRLDATLEVPNFVGRDIVQARLLAEKEGVKLCDVNEEGVVCWQYPPPDRLIFCDDEVLVAVQSTTEPAPRMIDLRGQSIRKATAFLSHIGVKLVVEGTGIIKEQSIPPGSTLRPGTLCRLTCRPS